MIEKNFRRSRRFFIGAFSAFAVILALTITLTALTMPSGEPHVNSFTSLDGTETVRHDSEDKQYVELVTGGVRLCRASGSTGGLFLIDKTVLADNGAASVVFSGKAYEAGVIFRYRDDNNYMRVSVNWNNALLHISQYVDGVGTNLTGGGAAISEKTDAELLVIFSGDTVEAYWGGEKVVTVTGAALTSIGYCGISNGGNTSMSDGSFVVSRMTVTRDGASAAPESFTVASGDMSVRLHGEYPAAYDYTLTASGEKMNGETSAVLPTLFINDTEYPVTVSAAQLSGAAVRYTLTVPDVVFGGLRNDVVIQYDYSVEGTTLVKRLVSVIGDVGGNPFRVRLKGAVLSLKGSSTKEYLSAVGNPERPDADGFCRSDMIWLTSPYEKTDLSYVFLSNRRIAATVYLKDQWHTPFTAGIYRMDSSRYGIVYEQDYIRRLADGTLVTVEAPDGTVSPYPYESYVYLCGDVNESGEADWQDAALWLRKQLPQVPEELRTFFNGGQWVQAAGAYPGNDATGAETTQGFCYVSATPGGILEIQKQLNNLTDGVGRTAYCYVGWQGQGHDYGWPNINEVPYNPALGTEADFVAVQKAIKAYGGTLGFHLNMTDISTVSHSYRRGSNVSPFGNNSVNTGVKSGTYYAGGWSYYQINHFSDYRYALARQDAFVERFEAPFILYQDVMLDYPMGDYGTAEEHYAHMTEINHWRTLGTYAATEYYRAQKRSDGGFIFNNYQDVSEFTSFLLAGQTYIRGTQNYQNNAEEYIWAILCPTQLNADNFVTGSQALAEKAILISLTNAYVSSKELISYGTSGQKKYTTWSDGVRYEASNSTGNMTISKDGVTVADLHTDGRSAVTGEAFVPAVDGSKRIFACSTTGGSKTWTLTSDTEGTSFALYRLSASGRVYQGELKAENGTVSFNMEPGTGYVLYPAEQAPGNETVVENFNINAVVEASSRPYASGTILEDNSPTGSILEIVDPALTPEGGWRGTLFSLYENWFDAGGNLRYYKYAVAGMTADNLPDTFWQPEEDDLADGEAWLSFRYNAPRAIKRFTLTFLDPGSHKVKIIGENAAGQTMVLFEGIVPGGKTMAVNTTGSFTGVRLTVSGNQTFRLSEFGAFSE